MPVETANEKQRCYHCGQVISDDNPAVTCVEFAFGTFPICMQCVDEWPEIFA